jgi:hypothetical protein
MITLKLTNVSIVEKTTGKIYVNSSLGLVLESSSPIVDGYEGARVKQSKPQAYLLFLNFTNLGCKMLARSNNVQ